MSWASLMEGFAEISKKISRQDEERRQERKRKIKSQLKSLGVHEDDIEEQYNVWLDSACSIENQVKEYKERTIGQLKFEAEKKYVMSEERRAEEKHKAELRRMDAESWAEEMKAEKAFEMNAMLKYIRENKLKDFPHELHYFVIACQAGDVTALNDIMQANALKEYLARREEAKVSKDEQEAKMAEKNVEEKDLYNQNLKHNLDKKRDRK